MARYKVVITYNNEEINEFLEQGWVIESVTPQRVAVTGDSYSTVRGKFCFVLER